MTNKDQLLSQTRAARKQAEELLNTLLHAKATGETDQSGRDLYRKVTGNSSLDNAIVQTRRTIETYDRVLAELRGEAPAPKAPTPRWQAAPVTVVFGEAARTA